MDNQAMSEIVESVVRRVISSQTRSAAVPDMTLDLAKRLIEKVRIRASEMGVNAVVAVSNRAARPVAVECMDDSYIASYDIAVNKAFTVVSLKMPTSKLKELAQPGAPLYGIQFTNQGNIVIFGGGVPLHDKNGVLIGGLGVSGGSEEQDTALAEYGESVFHQCMIDNL
ncbi:MAG: heme-binding protein [Clostridiales bacterium]|nr:heme-binding protein [Clostridiales bacterium]